MTLTPTARPTRPPTAAELAAAQPTPLGAAMAPVAGGGAGGAGGPPECVIDWPLDLRGAGRPTL